MVDSVHEGWSELCTEDMAARFRYGGEENEELVGCPTLLCLGSGAEKPFGVTDRAAIWSI